MGPLTAGDLPAVNTLERARNKVNFHGLNALEENSHCDGLQLQFWVCHQCEIKSINQITQGDIVAIQNR